MKKPVLLVLILFLLVLECALLFADDRMKGPLLLQQAPKNLPDDYQTSPVKLVLGGFIRFYAGVISPADGPRSPSYPTGTAYGIQVVQRYGFFPGIILIGDRLLHESDRHPGPEITIYGRQRHFDPPEHNTYWWDESVLSR